MRDRGHARGIKRGHIWTFLGDTGEVAFCEYTPDWKGTWPQAILADHDGAQPPRRFSSLATRLRRSDDVQYICLEEDALQWLVRPGPIEVPSIAERLRELPRIVDEYVLHATTELAPPPGALSLNDRDRSWLIDHAATTSLAEIEKAALRLVALRSSTNLSQAAARLGMAAVSLSRWAARRRLSPLPYGASAA